MKTPVNILLTAIAYWLALYATTLVPLVSKNYYLNLVWMTVMIPNIIRFAIGNIPTTRGRPSIFPVHDFHRVSCYLLSSTRFHGETKKAMTDHKADVNKKLKLSALLAGTFAIGVLWVRIILELIILFIVIWDGKGLFKA